MYYMDPDKWHTAVSEMEDYTVQDYDKAKEYLAKSKYPDGFEFDFYTLSANVPEAELIQSMVGEIGIKMNIKEILSADMFSYLYGFNEDENGNRPYQAFGSSWVSDYLDPVGNLKTMFHSSNTVPGCANQAMWKNADFDALIDKSYETTDDCQCHKWIRNYSLNKITGKYQSSDVSTRPIWAFFLSFSGLSISL